MDVSDMFTVTPMAQKIELKPGEVYTGEIIVANPASATQDFVYHASTLKYGVLGLNYQVDFEHESDYTQIVDWMTIENPTGTIKPNESAKIKYTIKVPETAPAGGQYAAIMIGSDGTKTGGDGVAVSNIYEMASIIYAAVDGETVREGEIVNNNFPSFATTLPITTSVVFKNNGNIHESAEISLEVRDAFSNNVIYPADGQAAVTEEIIMPGTTREFTQEIDGLAPLGIFQVRQKVSYMGEAYAEEHTLVLCPIWFMLLVAITVAAIIGVIVRLIMKHRRRPTAI